MSGLDQALAEMARVMRARPEDRRLAAVEALRAVLPQGARVYSVRRHRGPAGSSFTLELYRPDADGRMVPIGAEAAAALGLPYEWTRAGMRVSVRRYPDAAAVLRALSQALHGRNDALGNQPL